MPSTFISEGQIKWTTPRTKYDLNDISLMPSVLSNINTRSEVKPYYENGDLPIMVSPMCSVVDNTNWKLYFNNNFRVCMPRDIYDDSGQTF